MTSPTHGRHRRRASSRTCGAGSFRDSRSIPRAGPFARSSIDSGADHPNRARRSQSKWRPPHSVMPRGSRIGSRAAGISLVPMVFIASSRSIAHDALLAASSEARHARETHASTSCMRFRRDATRRWRAIRLPRSPSVSPYCTRIRIPSFSHSDTRSERCGSPFSSFAASRNVCDQEATEMNSLRMLPF
ncbi:hypothetical protein C8Q72DRAFT_300647 [Fomitopsis betulina]|nr:hypothetical protein C8Q72DRAFT_300647 [Fomitopsis betulina]